jgi:hypothetical protein
MKREYRNFLRIKKAAQTSRPLVSNKTTIKMKDSTLQGIILQFHQQSQTQLPLH